MAPCISQSEAFFPFFFCLLFSLFVRVKVYLDHTVSEPLWYILFAFGSLGHVCLASFISGEEVLVLLMENCQMVSMRLEGPRLELGKRGQSEAWPPHRC